MKTIIVPFESKKIAHNLGAVFNQKLRIWEIPDDLDPDVAEFLSNLPEMETDDAGEDDNISEIENNISNDKNNITPITPIHQANDWSQILQSDDTLIAAMAVRDYGLPEKEEDRTLLLKILGKRRNGDYAISYDALCGCSEIFASTYPISLITKLIQENVTAQNRYAEEIHTSMRLTDEEKALLMFALPA